ncbi:hypothetical protein [Nocardioides sp.]|uniref:hypothetical protein n=1 Tax=Nocardioides sp. TaxID=35761 RepID=UPI0019872E63|nr:hypothetical protein [Nocardioides sp.]MBC7279203.1 hypothetical protein [Nocardioides sp.]
MTVVIDPQVVRVSGGDFWHVDTGRAGLGSYARTACGRRLSRWHLMAPQRLSNVKRDAVCTGCIRALIRKGGK